LISEGADRLDFDHRRNWLNIFGHLFIAHYSFIKRTNQ